MISTSSPLSRKSSLTEIACHLRDVDLEVNLPRVQAVLETDNPFIAGAVTDHAWGDADTQAALRARGALGGRLGRDLAGVVHAHEARGVARARLQ